MLIKTKKKSWLKWHDFFFVKIKINGQNSQKIVKHWKTQCSDSLSSNTVQNYWFMERKLMILQFYGSSIRLFCIIMSVSEKTGPTNEQNQSQVSCVFILFFWKKETRAKLQSRLFKHEKHKMYQSISPLLLLPRTNKKASNCDLLSLCRPRPETLLHTFQFAKKLFKKKNISFMIEVKL